MNGIDPDGLTVRAAMQHVQYLLTIDRLCFKYKTLIRALEFEEFCEMDKL